MLTSIITFIKQYKTAFYALGIFGLISGYYFYMHNLYSKIDKLEKSNQVLAQSNETLRNSITTQSNTITKLQLDFALATQLRKDAEEKFAKIDKKKQATINRLSRANRKTSLSEIIVKDKKNRVEKVLNDSNNRFFNELEAITRE